MMTEDQDAMARVDAVRSAHALRQPMPVVAATNAAIPIIQQATAQASLALATLSLPDLPPNTMRLIADVTLEDGSMRAGAQARWVNAEGAVVLARAATGVWSARAQWTWTWK